MRNLVAIFQHWTLTACLAVLALLAAICLSALCGGLLERLRRVFARSAVQGGLAVVAVAFAVMYGGSKSIRWDTGLANNGTVISNDTVEVRWTYSGIPSASSVFIDYRLSGTEDEWENLAETTAYALEWIGTLANATNYDYWIYSTYVPPVPVHTNGVWLGQTYETKLRKGANAFLILNGKVKEHGRTIAPPAAKRKDAEDEGL